MPPGMAGTRIHLRGIGVSLRRQEAAWRKEQCG